MDVTRSREWSAGKAISNAGGPMSAKAYAVLKSRIVTCIMGPGLRVTEAGLAAQLRMGKTPVREALARLAVEGLVRSIPRHGYEVAPVTLSDVHDLFTLRLVVEPAAFEMAAGRVDEQLLRRLDRRCRAGYRSDDRASIEQFVQANRELHVSIARASGSAQLASVVEHALDASTRMLYIGQKLGGATEPRAHDHGALIDALVAGDRARARALATESILEMQRLVTQALVSSPTLMGVAVVVRG